jgi:hypothetical protein
MTRAGYGWNSAGITAKPAKSWAPALPAFRRHCVPDFPFTTALSNTGRTLSGKRACRIRPWLASEPGLQLARAGQRSSARRISGAADRPRRDGDDLDLARRIGDLQRQVTADCPRNRVHAPVLATGSHVAGIQHARFAQRIAGSGPDPSGRRAADWYRNRVRPADRSVRGMSRYERRPGLSEPCRRAVWSSPSADSRCIVSSRDFFMMTVGRVQFVISSIGLEVPGGVYSHHIQPRGEECPGVVTAGQVQVGGSLAADQASARPIRHGCSARICRQEHVGDLRDKDHPTWLNEQIKEEWP